MNKLKASSAAAALMVMVAQPAFAGTSTSTFTVTATVVASCASVSATNISLGNVLPSQTVATTGTISVTCASGTPYSVDLDQGQFYMAGLGQRGLFMDVNNVLQYNIFKEPTHTTPWGTTVQGGSAVSGVGTGATQSITAYGITIGINAISGTPANVGNYSDTVTVTLSF